MVSIQATIQRQEGNHIGGQNDVIVYFCVPLGLEYANSEFLEPSGTMLNVMRHIEHFGRGRPQCTQPVT